MDHLLDNEWFMYKKCKCKIRNVDFFFFFQDWPFECAIWYDNTNSQHTSANSMIANLPAAWHSLIGPFQFSTSLLRDFLMCTEQARGVMGQLIMKWVRTALFLQVVWRKQKCGEGQTTSIKGGNFMQACGLTMQRLYRGVEWTLVITMECNSEIELWSMDGHDGNQEGDPV